MALKSRELKKDMEQTHVKIALMKKQLKKEKDGNPLNLAILLQNKDTMIKSDEPERPKTPPSQSEIRYLRRYERRYKDDAKRFKGDKKRAFKILRPISEDPDR